MKDFRIRNLNLITYLDDASRCVAGYGVFRGNRPERRGCAQAGNSGVLHTGIHPVGQRILLCGRVKRHAEGHRVPIAFEDKLLDRGMHLINSMPYHPQTNGKLERLHRTLEAEVGRHDSLDDFVTYYDERRLHWSLDRQPPDAAQGVP